MTLKLIYAGFNYVADVDNSYALADSLPDLQSQTASNAVALAYDYGIDPETSTVFADTTTDAQGDLLGNTESPAHVAATIAEAEADGLSVMLRPLIDFTHDETVAMLTAPATPTQPATSYTDGEFRGWYVPSDPAAFFASYDDMIVAQARAAQAGGVPLLDIGTELDQITGPAYLPYWQRIIADVRAVYGGKLTYSAVSDDDQSYWQYNGARGAAGTGDLATQVSFWSLLDYVGIDEYAPISDTPDPTLDQLVAGWEGVPTDTYALRETGGLSLIQYYEQVAAETGKPLLFTEIGYTSAPDAAINPPYTASSTYDPALQARLYQAFFQAWQDQGNTSLQGVYLWDWEPSPSNVGVGTEPTWTPQGNAGAIEAVDAAYTAATALRPATADFDGDGTSDMLWQGPGGALVVYTMRDGAIAAGALVGALDPGNRFLAAGDFNGDGTADQLWQSAGGAIVDFAMRAGAVTGASVVGGLDASWRFLAAGDFNGDGTDDMLWQAGDGAIVDYSMAGGAIAGGAVLGALDASWRFLAAGDFDGDRTDDMLWQAADGEIVDYGMHAGAIVSAASIGTLDASWTFLAAADFNGDGTDDMLWQASNGAVVDFGMLHGAIASAAVVAVFDSTFKFLAAGDLDGEGTADMLWQAAGGAIVDDSMHDGTISGTAIVGSLDPSYKFLA